MTLIFTPVSASGAPKPGSACSKGSKPILTSGARFTCTKVGAKYIWRRQPLKAPKPTSTTTPATTTPETSGFVFQKYNGGPGAGGASMNLLSVVTPINLVSSGDHKLKLWVYDPENPTRALGSPGIFRKAPTSDWELLKLNPDGSYYGTWPAGTYSIDTVEPNGNMQKYDRRRYIINIDQNGSPSVEGLDANPQGFFSLTINLNPATPPDTFTPANVCQLRGQDGNRNMNVGFPRRPDRVPNVGKVRAAFIPVSFPDLPANGDPLTLYRFMAQGMYDFFSRASGGRVQFSYDVLTTWVPLSFSVSKYNLGKWNGGDPGGYYNALVREADPYIDYSLFDVVYFLSPTNVKSNQIAYGPATPMRVQTADGVLRNGTFSGADAYNNGVDGPWKWSSHETGHLYGIYDLYTVDPQPATYGFWDLMANNWSNEAIELNAWNRFTQDWLGIDQYVCVDAANLTPKDYTLIPIGSEGIGQKAVFIKLSDSKILVIELRRTAGLDKITWSQEGMLVYTVDMTIESIKGGFKTQRRPGSTDPNFMDAALRVGDEITVDGIRVNVSTSDPNTVRVSRA